MNLRLQLSIGSFFLQFLFVYIQNIKKFKVGIMTNLIYLKFYLDGVVIPAFCRTVIMIMTWDCLR